MDIGTKIKKARIQNYISQVQLAEMLNTSQSLIAAYESGRKVPKLETIERIAAALNVSVLSLLPSNVTDNAAALSSSKESELYELFSVLNQEGKKKVCEYAADLAGNPDYTK